MVLGVLRVTYVAAVVLVVLLDGGHRGREGIA